MDDQNFGLDPGRAYRFREGPRLFGIQKSRICEAINLGLIPPPIAVVEGGKAKIWIGTQIIEHRRERMAAALKQREEAA
jgi:hypothetical protein